MMAKPNAATHIHKLPKCGSFIKNHLYKRIALLPGARKLAYLSDMSAFSVRLVPCAAS
jgi:hypothetical protein